MKLCAICEKGSVTEGKRSFLRSHYNPTHVVRKYPNLQWARMSDGVRAKICVRCLKSTKKKVSSK